MRKAISELVVIVMLLMISIVLVGLAFVFISGFQEQAKSEVQQTGTEAFKNIGSCLQTVSFDDNTNNLYVKNCGRYPIDNVTVFIDKKPVSSVSINAKPNEIRNITISATAGAHEIKIVGDYASAAISVNVTNAAPVCSDGTPYGQCSVSKPLYCSAGALVNKCSACGCSSLLGCEPTENCVVQPFYQEDASSILMANEYLYVNYSKPIYSYNNSLWQIKIGSATANYSIPIDCWSYSSSKLIFRIYSYWWGNAQYSIECFNSTWKVLQANSGYFGGGDAGAVANGNEAYDGDWSTWSIYSGFDSSLRTNETNAWTKNFRLYEEGMWWIE